MKENRKKLAALFLAIMPVVAGAGVVKGRVTDADGGAAVGAVVRVKGAGVAVVTDVGGRYALRLPAGSYTLEVSCAGFLPLERALPPMGDEGETVADLRLEADARELDEVTVTARARRDTEAAQTGEQRMSLLVQTGVSAQQLSRTQDRDAGEAAGRLPGVSVIDGKFVMVRGLSQRYNDVWLNGSAVPSTEADSRAFSFDIIPSGQLDNMVVVKSPAPEYPADFTGGFVLLNTKDTPDADGLRLGVGAGVDDQTHFRRFLRAHGSGWDWLGFGSGSRSLAAGMTGALVTHEGYDGRIDLLGNGFDNDWRPRTRKPVADLKADVGLNRHWQSAAGAAWGLLAAVNYSHSRETLRDMENSLYGPYDTSNDKAVALRKATDNQWSTRVRLGGMLNVSFAPRGGRHRFEWKNLFNQLAHDRYTERTGQNAQPDNINDMEYYYSSRTTLNTQFTGKHTWRDAGADWSAGYAYANRDMPDRRLIERNDRTDNTMGIYRISREFSRLDEHVGSAAANYRRDFRFGAWEPMLKAGAYGERRSRAYRAREFQYAWSPTNTLPEGFEYDEDVQGSVLVDGNYGVDKLYLQEEVNYMNNYEARNTLLACYAGVNLPAGDFNVYAGVRYEHDRQELIMNTRQAEESKHSTFYTYSDLFPSVNATWRLTPRHQLRLAYGKSTNRPEFRELSTSVYYDFDLGSSVTGNAELKAAYIHNLDVRYEWYPGPGEQISVALFHKHFDNPIEWTYTMTGGTDPVYSYVNAKGANNYGIEVDLRKSLDFVGLTDWSLSLNAAWIRSRVQFEKGSSNLNRPMQGQSPYLVNAGVYYNNAGAGWSGAVLYNRIGKRIVGVGNRYGTSSDGDARNIPNSYEMPRNSVDLSAGKALGHWELKLAVRDLLAERCRFMQFEEVTTDGERRTIEEVTRSWKPGRTVILTVSCRFD